MLRSRFVMFTASSFWVALILVISVFRGGGAGPVGPRLEGSRLPSGLSPAKQAAELADLGDYEGAWQLYHEALAAEPEDVSLWYALGVTLSRLGQRQETEAAFRYVVARGNPDSGEVKAARQWLVGAGVLAPPVVFTATEPAEVVDAKAAVKGRVAWSAPERDTPPAKARILLQGLSGAAKGKRFTTRVALGETYRFERLPAGAYRLIGALAGQRLWDLTVAVEEKDIVLDLTRENSSPNVAVALNQ